MTIQYAGDKVYMIYNNQEEAEEAFERLKAWKPTIVCCNGYMNALEITIGDETRH